VKAGDLVRASHWNGKYLGTIVSIRKIMPFGRHTGICQVLVNGALIDQLMGDLEIVLNK
jgi:hypothetical protein